MVKILKEKSRLGKFFRICPVRHVLTLLFAFSLVIFYLLRNISAYAQFFYDKITMPALQSLAKACSAFSFSLSALLIAGFFILAVIYIMYMLLKIIKKGEKLKNLYRLCLTCLMLFLLVLSGYSNLWGICYYAQDFTEKSGIEVSEISVSELQTVTVYFANLANEYSELVQRDENGLFAEDMDEIFSHSASLYDDAVQLYPFLDGYSIPAKPFLFSKFLSYIGFTGFIFPFTGEANLNTDCTDALIPSTIAHEIAHQRGIAAEDEANFVAVLACFENGDTAYCYSASLLAYIHLGNALYKADRAAWSEVYASLFEPVKADFAANSAYWAQFETPVSDVSETIYESFLQTNGQEMGMKTYGACIDLLVAYYLPLAESLVR